MSDPAKNILKNALYIIAVVALVFAIWAVAAAIVDTQFILPDIGMTFGALGTLFKTPAFWKGLGLTLLRALFGFALSAALFFVLFYLSVCFEAAAGIIDPIVSALRTLPTMAAALVLSVWAGANATPVILGVIVVMPQLYSSARAHHGTVDKDLVEISMICGANRWQTFCAVYLPHAASGFPESLPSALSFSVKIIIAAEILMQTASSLGILMAQAQMMLQTASLIAMTFIAVVISVAVEILFKLLLRKLLSRFIY